MTYKRQFKKIIFFGQEECVKQKLIVQDLLDRAFNLISGLQQPDHPNSEKHAIICAKERSSSNTELKLIREDIWTVLGGEGYSNGK